MIQIRPRSTATSARYPGAPVPSTTMPPRINKSGLTSESLRRGSEPFRGWSEPFRGWSEPFQLPVGALPRLVGALPRLV